MLTITPRAWRAIDDITHEHHAPALRVTRSDCGSLALDVAAGPETDDTVVWSLGSVVYVDRHAAEAVDHKVLDLRESPGAQSFYLR